jgi:hypothetical protein
LLRYPALQVETVQSLGKAVREQGFAHSWDLSPADAQA